MKKLLSILMVTSALVGCGNKEEIESIKNDITSIKSNLGSSQYVGLDPQLSFTFPVAEFSPPNERFITTPNLNYSMNVKQNNKAFPLLKYSVNAEVDILDGANVKRGVTIIHVDVDNGVGSVANMEVLYAVKYDNLQSLENYKAKVTGYRWYENQPLRPFEPVASKT